MIRDSLDALGFALDQECQKSKTMEEHSLIRISIAASYVPNGLRYCSVNVECGAGCGWLIEMYGSEAEALEHEARAFQVLLDDSNRALSISEIVALVYPKSSSGSSSESPALIVGS
jgi:hypothetical protein